MKNFLRDKKQFFYPLLGLAVGWAMLTGAFPSAAYAQTSTPTATLTPTITEAPSDPFVIPTRGTNPEDFECPEGYPEGWLTVTPSSLWDIVCSQCFISATGTPEPATSTPTPGAGTPTVTPVTPTATVGPYYYAGGEWIHPFDIVHTAGGGYWVIKEWEMNMSDYLTGIVYKFSGGGGGLQIKPMAASPVSLFYGDTSFSVYDAEAKVCICEWSGSCVWMFEAAHIYDCDYTTNMAYWNQPVGAGVRNVEWQVGYVGSRTYSMDYIQPVYYGVPSGPTPTPMPTAIPVDSYCSVIDPGEQQEEDFLWSGITWGASYCIDIGPYVLFDIPHVAHICVQNISMGYVYVFGIKVLLDIILYVFGGVMIVRMIT